mgnify:CR=1 FL=1
MKLNGNFKGRLHQYFMRKIGAFGYRHSWVKSDCPYCGGEKKFGINLSNNRCNCFKCGEHPSPISLVMYLDFQIKKLICFMKDIARTMPEKKKR